MSFTIFVLLKLPEQPTDGFVQNTYKPMRTVLPNLAGKCQILHFFGFFSPLLVNFSLLYLWTPYLCTYDVTYWVLTVGYVSILSILLKICTNYTRSSDSAPSICAILWLVLIKKLPKSSFSALLELNIKSFPSD